MSDTRVPADFPTARAEARSAYRDWLEEWTACGASDRAMELWDRQTEARDRMNALRPTASRLAVGGAA